MKCRLLVVTPPGPRADELASTLVDRGFEVARVASGADALPAALRAPPDAILMDSTLSAMDRWHAVKRLNAESRTSRVPVLTLASDAHSPAGLQRLLGKIEETVGQPSAPAAVDGEAPTPVSAVSRVATARRVVALPTERDAPRTPPSGAPREAGPARVMVSAATPAPALVAVGSAPPPAAARAEGPAPATVAVSERLAAPAEVEARILVVDDNDLNRDMLTRRLNRRGYDVEAVEDGERALAALNTGRFDLVLLDWMMPGLSGIDVLGRIRERFSAVQLPVIMATAKSEADDIVQALQAEANDYVTKPLNFDVVIARIKTQLSLVRAHQELIASEQRYRALLENTGDMIVQYSLEGRVRYVSPACRTLLGFEPHEVRARSWYEGLHPLDRRELLNQQDQRSLPTNFTYIARMLRKDGSFIWVETSCKVIRARDTGAVDVVQAACRDVTEHMERIIGDEPPLPLGGDIMAHPGWRGPSTGEPAPSRPDPEPARQELAWSAPPAASPPAPVVVIGAVPGFDPSVLVGLPADALASRVAAALRALSEPAR